jgi:ribosomal protein S18 acetylase RimI-like enzyme
LADTLVYYKNSHCRAVPLTMPDEYSWRLANEADADEVGSLSERIFKNYQGHYHADRRLNKSDCDQVYVSWAVNSCLHANAADAMLLILFDKRIAGFLTVKVIDSESCEIVLNGVDPDFQNKGIYSMLMTLAKKWAAEHQLGQIIVSTQLNNLAVQKVWCRHGFEPYKSFYTFHKWFSS